jgi:hypothetical protein
MGTKVIANVTDLIEGDESVMIVLDVNIIDDALQGVLDTDYDMTITIPRATGSNLYTAPMVYQKIIDQVSSSISAIIYPSFITRYEVFVPGWNAYRDQGYSSPFYFDEFLNTDMTDGNIGELGWRKIVTGDGAILNQSAGPLVFPGALSVISGTAVQASPYIYFDQVYWDDVGEMTFVWHTNTITTTYMEVGVYDGGTWRFSLLYNSGTSPSTYYAWVRNNAGTSVITAFPNITAAASHRLKLVLTRLSNTQTQFYLENHVGQTSTLVMTHTSTSGFPPYVAPFFMVRNEVAAQRFIVVDYFSVKFNLNRSRT